MAFQSMTGFAQAHFSDETCELGFELRSVNAKGLDVRFRLPPEYSFLEQSLKKRLGEKIQRGTIQGTLSFECNAADAQPVIVNAVLETYLKNAIKAAEQNGLEKPRVEALMSLPGVVQFNNQDGLSGADKTQQEVMQAKIETLFNDALDNLVKSRETEGAALIDLFKKQISHLTELVEAASKDDSLDPDVMRTRLQKQVATLLDGDGQNIKKLDGDRLYQEVAILINRADVKEELDRLKAHIKAIDVFLSDTSGGAIGKKLDFLAQELNREANTLCSKSISPSLSAIGVEMKTTIDQFREQVQNLQ